MRSIFRSAVPAFLLLAAIRCFALMELADVSKEKAKELGVTIRSNANGESGVAVWIEFKALGALENFARVELQIDAGGKRLVDAPLLTSRPTPDSVSARFSADPSFLATSVLTIVVQNRERTRIGYRFKVKDFIETKKSP